MQPDRLQGAKHLSSGSNDTAGVGRFRRLAPVRVFGRSGRAWQKNQWPGREFAGDDLQGPCAIEQLWAQNWLQLALQAGGGRSLSRSRRAPAQNGIAQPECPKVRSNAMKFKAKSSSDDWRLGPDACRLRDVRKRPPEAHARLFAAALARQRGQHPRTPTRC